MMLMVLLHILCSFWFVSGLLGRWLTYTQARRASTVQTVDALLGLSDRFERWMVIPGSQGVLVFGLLAAWLEGQPILGSLGGGTRNWVLISLLLFVAVMPIVIWLLIPRRKLRIAALAVARERGSLTVELQAALSDRVVLGSRSVELAIIGLILILMVFKPF